jgi:hypothetical protein
VGQIYFGNGDGTFGLAGNFGGSGDFLAVGDFDGDGTADIAQAEGFPNAVRVWLGNGDGTFMPPVDYPTDLQPVFVALGDFDGDATPDLAVANYSSNTVDILLGNGDGTFQPAVTYPVGSGPLSVTVGDFDGDGTPDLAVAATDQVNGSVSVLLGNGDGTFQPAVQYAAGGVDYFVAVGDFNAAGFPDLAVNNYDTGTVSVLINAADWGNSPHGSGERSPRVDLVPDPVTRTSAEPDQPSAQISVDAHNRSQAVPAIDQIQYMDRLFATRQTRERDLHLPNVRHGPFRLVDDDLQQLLGE